MKNPAVKPPRLILFERLRDDSFTPIAASICAN